MKNVSPHHAPPQRQQQRPSGGGRIVSVSRNPGDHSLMWLVIDPQQQRRYFTVTRATETLHCACQAGQTPTPCPHLSAVQAWLKVHRQQAHNSISPEKAEPRDQTLSWSDDQAFSIWKA